MTSITRARWSVDRSLEEGFESADVPPPSGRAAGERPKRRSRVTFGMVWELGGSAAASLALVWVVFSLAGQPWSFGLVVSWLLAFLLLYSVVCWRIHGLVVMKDRLASVGMWAGALAALIPLVALIGYVAVKGAPVVFARFPHFLTADMVQAGANNPVTDVGVGPAIVGTVEQVALAALMSVPLGLLTAMYLTDHSGPFARLIGSVVDASSGMPAIVTGIFIYIVWVVPQKTAGKSGFAAAMALAVMMLPTVTRTAQEVIAVVPGSLREAALALGAPRWRVMLRVVLPTARAGLSTAIILGIARIAGETAPVLFNAGGNVAYNWNPFHGQQDDLPFRIQALIFQGEGNLTRDAWGVSFMLVVVILALFIAARVAGASRPGKRLTPLGRIRASVRSRVREVDSPSLANLPSTFQRSDTP